MIKLKTDSSHKIPLILGLKTMEIRKNDRNFEVGDKLLLEFIDEYTCIADGDSLTVNVNHILEGGQYGLDEDYCIMSITPVVYDGLGFKKEY